MIPIVKASPDDIEGIERVVRQVWDMEILPGACRRLIAGERSAIWVAKSGDAVLGFASGFQTLNLSSQRRGEIDLLAVNPSQQGAGLGPRLISALGEEEAGWGVDTLRALIRVANGPSQKAFSRAGFTTDGRVHQLLLWSPRSSLEQPGCPEGISFIPVDTITYRGLWIEGLSALDHHGQRAAVAGARALIYRENRLNTGALIPAEHSGALARDLVEEATMQGDYHWFRRRLK